MSSGRSRSGGSVNREDVDAVVEVLAELPVCAIASRSRLVAHTTRTSAVCSTLPPTRVYSNVSSTRNRSTCARSDIVDTSSRKMVPPSAAPNLPSAAETAPVNAPFSCPNSSDSIRSCGIAPVCTGTNGPAVRARALVDRARHQLLAGAGLADDRARSRRSAPPAVMLSNTLVHRRERASMPSNTSSSAVLDGEQRVGQIRRPLGDQLRDQLLELRRTCTGFFR